MKILVPLSSYPIFNIRYTKLLSELSKKAEIYVIAGSKLKNPSYIISNNLKVIYSLPFTLPRRIRYVIGPHLSQIIAQDSAKFLKYDFIWLIDSITFYTALRGRGPFIIDADDPTFRYLSLRERIKSSIESKFIRSKKVVRIITTSNLLKEKFVKFLKIEESKIVVIPNGVDLNIFRETPIPSEPIVLYYGTLVPHRAKLLMSVIEEVLKKKPESKFIIIGDVPDSLKNTYRVRG